MKINKKQGVSLMVLVITIIVMVVLAGTVIVSLNNSGIIGRTQGAVNEYNLKQVEELANVAWGEAFVKGNRTVETLKTYILNDLKQNGVNLNNYNIEVTEKGVVVTKYDGRITLGSLITSALDYDKTVNYEANGITDWKVFFKQTVAGEDYVYLIASTPLPTEKVPSHIPDMSISWENKVYWPSAYVEQGVEVENKTLWLAEWSEEYNDSSAAMAAAQLLHEPYWEEYVNSQLGAVGAIGAPTLEMLAASYNERSRALADTGENNILTLTKEDGGYAINGSSYITLSREDKLYASNPAVWIAAPNHAWALFSLAGAEIYNTHLQDSEAALRPVVCIKASTPARLKTASDSTDIVLE